MMGAASDIRAVVFDVDGVLVEVRFPTVLLDALKISASDTNEFFSGPFLDCLMGRTQLREVLPPYLAKWRWKGSFEEFTDFWFETESHIHHPTLELADRLSANGLRCFLASTQEHLRAEYLEKRLGVGNRFEKAFFSCRLGCRKPDPKFYVAVATEIGLPPGQILLLDDQGPNVEAAQAMGWRAAIFRIGDDLNALLPSFGLRHGA
jgi:putative hydrolase of the HAD superfamily